jgi:hypothetical protein
MTAPVRENRLRKRQRHVASAGRQVDDEIIQFAPINLVEELLDDAMHHRAAPDDRLLRLDHEAHGHDLDAGGLERHELLAADAGFFELQPAHLGDRRAVDVRVEQADLRALAGQTDGGEHGDRRFADAALTGADGDGVFHAGEACGEIRRRADLGRPFRSDGQCTDFSTCVRRHFIWSLSGQAGGGQLDADLDATVGDGDALNHVESNKILSHPGSLTSRIAVRT